MFSLTNSIINLNFSTTRFLIGVWFNDQFFHVERSNLATDYINIKILSLIGSLSPFLYMWYFVPTNEEVKMVQDRNVEYAEKKGDDGLGLQAKSIETDKYSKVE